VQIEQEAQLPQR